MKKIALSAFVIAASGVYVWTQSGAQPSGDILGPAAEVDKGPTGAVADRAVNINDGPAAAANKPVVPSVVDLPKEPGENDRSQAGRLAAFTETEERAGAPSTPPLPVVPRILVGPAGAAAPTNPLPSTPSQRDPAPESPASAVLDVPLPRPRPEYRLTRASAPRVAMTVSAAAG